MRNPPPGTITIIGVVQLFHRRTGREEGWQRDKRGRGRVWDLWCERCQPKKIFKRFSKEVPAHAFPPTSKKVETTVERKNSWEAEKYTRGEIWYFPLHSEVRSQGQLHNINGTGPQQAGAWTCVFNIGGLSTHESSCCWSNPQTDSKVKSHKRQRKILTQIKLHFHPRIEDADWVFSFLCVLKWFYL